MNMSNPFEGIQGVENLEQETPKVLRYRRGGPRLPDTSFVSPTQSAPEVSAQEIKASQESVERKHVIHVDERVRTTMNKLGLLFDEDAKVIEYPKLAQKIHLSKPGERVDLLTNIFELTPHQLGIDSIYERDGKRYSKVMFITIRDGGFEISNGSEKEKSKGD